MKELDKINEYIKARKEKTASIAKLEESIEQSKREIKEINLDLSLKKNEVKPLKINITLSYLVGSLTKYKKYPVRAELEIHLPVPKKYIEIKDYLKKFDKEQEVGIKIITRNYENILETPIVKATVIPAQLEYLDHIQYMQFGENDEHGHGMIVKYACPKDLMVRLGSYWILRDKDIEKTVNDYANQLETEEDPKRN